jgi:hypothetical protein
MIDVNIDLPYYPEYKARFYFNYHFFENVLHFEFIVS